MMTITKISRPHVMVAAVGALVLLGAATAAVTLSYAGSTATVSAKPAPVVFEPGGDAAFADYVPAFTMSTNATSFSVSLRGIPEVPVVMTDLLRVKNVDAREHTVTLHALQVTNTFVTSYRMDVYDGAALVATLDLKAPSPTATFTMPAGASYTAQATVVLASGAGAHNVADQRTLNLLVSA